MNQLLGGRYQLIKILGSDALGRTYLVVDTQLSDHPKRIVRHLKLPDRNPRTLKFVLTLLNKKAEALQKFSKHDRVPEILDYFEEYNNFYIVEEFIQGRSLAEEILPGQPMAEGQVVPLLSEMLDILVVVHGWGVVHRCINPSSIIRRQSDGALVLTGFGVFKEIGAQVARSPAYSSGNGSNGSVVYAPPDQLQGHLHFNTDLYAIGMIGIQAVTGLAADDLSKQSYGDAADSQEPSWHGQAQISLEFIEILDRMVHPDSRQRYQQATEVLDDLQKTSVGKDITPKTGINQPNSAIMPPTSPPPKQPPVSKPWQRPLTLLLVLLAFLAGAVVLKVPQTLLAQYFLQRGSQENQRNQDEQAIASYTQAIRLHPSSHAYYQRAIAYNHQQEPQAALADLTEAIQLDPNLSEAYYQRGNLWFELGDRQKALADYTQAIRLEPNTPQPYVNRGTVRAELGDERGAIEDYTQAIQVDPSLTAAYLNRCLSLSNLNEHQAAIADCTQAISLEPNSVRAYQNRGLARRRLGDRTGAIEDFNIAIRLDSKDPDPYYNRGLARDELGDKQGAIADYTSAIQQDPDHVFAYYDRGVARAALGDREGAIADFQQSAKLCLDSGRMGCYQDAQFQLSILQPGASDLRNSQ